MPRPLFQWPLQTDQAENEEEVVLKSKIPDCELKVNSLDTGNFWALISTWRTTRDNF
jgi:hypothetical protein